MRCSLRLFTTRCACRILANLYNGQVCIWNYQEGVRRPLLMPCRPLSRTLWHQERAGAPLSCSCIHLYSSVRPRLSSTNMYASSALIQIAPICSPSRSRSRQPTSPRAAPSSSRASSGSRSAATTCLFASSTTTPWNARRHSRRTQTTSARWQSTRACRIFSRAAMTC